MIQAILTDIEGTTSSISFVKDVLFPYATQALPDYLRRHACDAAVQQQLNTVATESGLDPQDTEALIQQLLQWIQEDRKITCLKALQGMVWRHGYEQGVYRAHVYPDAVQQLTAWRDSGLRLYVYSSCSIAAQELIFQYSEAGVLRHLFSGHFDTTSGAKQSVASYQRILQQMGLPPEQVLFLSDIEGELDAARQAGLRTAWLVREQDSPLLPEELSSVHPVVSSFAQINVSDFC